MEFVKALPFSGILIPHTLSDDLRLVIEGTTLIGLAEHGNFTISKGNSFFEMKLCYQTFSLEIPFRSVREILEAIKLGKTPEEIRLQILDIWSKPPSVSAPDISPQTTFHSIVNLSSVTNPHGFLRRETSWDAVKCEVGGFICVIKPGDLPSMLALTLWDMRRAEKATGQVDPNNLAKILSRITPKLSKNDFWELCDSVE
jgi:hypothetical protein